MSSSHKPLAKMIEDAFREGRRDGMTITAVSELIAEVIRSEVLDKIGEKELAGMAAPDYVNLQSIVGAASGYPMVQCRVGFEQWQWEVEDARNHALALLQVAEAAVHDAAMLRWLTLGELGLPKNAAHHAIHDLRRFRGDVDREDWRPPEREELPDDRQ